MLSPMKFTIGGYYWLNSVGPLRLEKLTRSSVMIFRSLKNQNDVYSSAEHLGPLTRARFDNFKAECAAANIEHDFADMEKWIV